MTFSIREVNVEWQRVDTVLGIVQPWFTHPALDEIQDWILNDKKIWEWGGGCSTFWWSKRCLQVYTIDADKDWCDWIVKTTKVENIKNITVEYRAADDPNYTYIPDSFSPDIVVVDGSSRTNCLFRALEIKRPVTIIFDNWQQDFVYSDPVTEKLMSKYEGKIYLQPGHKNHQGHPWQTAIWHLK